MHEIAEQEMQTTTIAYEPYDTWYEWIVTNNY